MSLLLTMTALAQDIFNESNSNRWLVLPPNPQQEQQYGIKMPTGYIYNIPHKVRVEVFDNAEAPDMVQINALDGNFDYEQNNYTSETSATVIYFNNDSVPVNNETLTLERCNDNAQMLMSRWLDKHDVQSLIHYLLTGKGFIRLTVPILGKGDMTVDIPCVEGRAVPANK